MPTIFLDNELERLAAFTTGLSREHLPTATVRETTRRLLDTIGCGLAAFEGAHTSIARRLALRAPDAAGATLLGTRTRVNPELATFANGTACRMLEGNDVFPGGGHPSDCIPAVIAAAEVVGADAATVLTGIVAAYEVYASVFAATRVRDRGFDYVVYTAAGSAAGAARAMDFDVARTREALALAITANLGLAATRRGHVSIWKNLAGPNAARNGLFAAMLAREGITGPPAAIGGVHGLAEIAGRYTPPLLPSREGGYAIERADIKSLLTEFHSQAPILCAIELRRQIIDAGLGIDAIAAVRVETYAYSLKELASDREKWRPPNHESADHSLPYLVAAALMDGEFGARTFAPERFTDPAMHALMDRIEARENPEFTAVFSAQIPCRMELDTANGRRFTAQMQYPRGHHRNPLDDDELDAKFRRLAGAIRPAARVEAALRMLRGFDGDVPIADLMQAMAL